jgi:hypothetical protein
MSFIRPKLTFSLHFYSYFCLKSSTPIPQVAAQKSKSLNGADLTIDYLDKSLAQTQQEKYLQLQQLNDTNARNTANTSTGELPYDGANTHNLNSTTDQMRGTDDLMASGHHQRPNARSVGAGGAGGLLKHGQGQGEQGRGQVTPRQTGEMGGIGGGTQDL